MTKSQESKTFKSFLRWTLVIFFVFSSSLPVYTQAVADKGGVRISWEEFRKLLELDKDEFVLSWEEFQIMLRQTGFKYVPPYQLKQEQVILNREQFKRLLNQMKPPVDTTVQPPADYLLTRAAYTGRIAAGSAQFHAAYFIEIFERQRNQFVKIPFFPVSIALKSALIDGKQALIVLDGNRHTLTTSEWGQHKIDLDFALKAATEEGPWSVTFPIPRTAVTNLEFEIPFEKIEVEISNAQELEVTERKGLTHVRAVLSPSDSITIGWRKRPAEVEKGPAKIYSEILSLLSLEDDALRVNATLTLSILQNTISSLTLKVPAGYNILEVKGNGIEDWREIESKGSSYLEILLAYPKKGNLSLLLVAEKLLPNSSMTVDYTGFALQDAVREKGFLGIELKSTSEVTLANSEGLDKLDVSELPHVLINRSQKPLLFGFKYLRHPYSLVLDIKKHEELPVIGTVIDLASGVTLFTEDGKLVHRIVYRVRNTSKQFLELELPPEAQIWSVFVGGEPAKPRLSSRRILIPLNRSSQGASGLEAFDVELIYFQRADRFDWMGRKGSVFPVPDVLISQMLWSVYLPEGFRFGGFGGSVEKEKTAQGLRPFLISRKKPITQAEPHPGAPDEDKERIRQEASKVKDQFSANLALTEEQLVQQIKNEAEFSQRVDDIQSGKAPSGGGILPIRIQVPATGQLFRFAKTIVSGDMLNMNCSYISAGAIQLMKVVLYLTIFALLFGFRRKIVRVFLGLLKKLKKIGSSRENE